MRCFRIIALGSALALAACSGNSGGAAKPASAGAQAGPSVAPVSTPTNPTGFPLYTGSQIITTKNFTEKLDAAELNAAGGAFSQGSGTYAGHQVIARTPATMEQLSSWLTTNSQAPPPGFSVPAEGSEIARSRAQVAQYGIDFAPFVREENGTKVGFLVIALDPQMLNRKLGPAIGLIDNFRSLPQMLRGPVDKQVKERIGITATEALEPASPLGAALSAYDDVKSSNDRAIVVVDAAKQ